MTRRLKVESEVALYRQWEKQVLEDRRAMITGILRTLYERLTPELRQLLQITDIDSMSRFYKLVKSPNYVMRFQFDRYASIDPPCHEYADERVFHLQVRRLKYRWRGEVRVGLTRSRDSRDVFCLWLSSETEDNG
jgi:hypothetical protein